MTEQSQEVSRKYVRRGPDNDSIDRIARGSGTPLLSVVSAPDVPQIVPLPAQLPAPGTAPDTPALFDSGFLDRHTAAIMRRKRRSAAWSGLRLSLFILAPTACAGYYFHEIATPLFKVSSEFVVQSSEPSRFGEAAMPAAMGGSAGSKDALVLQSYLTSRDAMDSLERMTGFSAHFADPAFDRLTRIPAGASREDIYDAYTKNVTVGYDASEGIIRLDILSPDAQVGAAMSQDLIAMAQIQVERMTERLRTDRVLEAENTYVLASEAMNAANEDLITLQERYSIISADTEDKLLSERISTLEAELSQHRMDLAIIDNNRRPNIAQRDAVTGKIGTVQSEIDALRARTSQSGTGDAVTIARSKGEIARATSDIKMREIIMTSSLQSLEEARRDAQRQARYISVGVQPTATDKPDYPKPLQATLIAFIALCMAYVFGAITLGAFRDQSGR